MFSGYQSHWVANEEPGEASPPSRSAGAFCHSEPEPYEPRKFTSCIDVLEPASAQRNNRLAQAVGRMKLALLSFGILLGQGSLILDPHYLPSQDRIHVC